MPPLYLSKRNLSAVLLDTSMFIRYHNFPEELCEHLGNPQIHHTDITIEEWQSSFMWHGIPNETAKGLTEKSLEKFNSSYLPEIPAVEIIAAEVEEYLGLAGIEIETESDKPDIETNDKRDILTFTHGVAHGVDVVSNDRLFFPMGELFHTGIKTHVNIKSKSSIWIRQLQAELAANGVGKVGTPIDLTHLL